MGVRVLAAVGFLRFESAAWVGFDKVSMVCLAALGPGLLENLEVPSTSHL